jgi:hypothetical protein
MSSFRWRDSVGLSLGGRYSLLAPSDFAGIGEWELFTNSFPFQSASAAWRFLKEIHRAKPASARKCPRIFISHRHGDEPLALRIAWLAHQQGIEYWLDVIDIPPIFAAGLPLPLSAVNQAILIGAIIEVALINCTHAIAVITPNTSGSAWVPYEYGRIKDDPPGDLTVGSWIDFGVSTHTLPEYLHLAPIFPDEPNMVGWMKHERAQFADCSWAGEEWTREEPAALPASSNCSIGWES